MTVIPYQNRIYPHTYFNGRYIAFGCGPFKGEQKAGGKTKGRDIRISDLSGKLGKVTNNSNHNKEPDWVPIPISSP